MKIVIIDGQGGRMGKAVIEQLKSSLFKKAHFPSSQPPISRPLYFMGVFGSRSQEGRDLLR